MVNYLSAKEVSTRAKRLKRRFSFFNKFFFSSVVQTGEEGCFGWSAAHCDPVLHFCLFKRLKCLGYSCSENTSRGSRTNFDAVLTQRLQFYYVCASTFLRTIFIVGCLWKSSPKGGVMGQIVIQKEWVLRRLTTPPNNLSLGSAS